MPKLKKKKTKKKAGIVPVGQGLEVDGGGRYRLPRSFLLRVRVEPVGQVASRRKVEPHDAVVRLQEAGVHGEVRGGTAARDFHARTRRVCVGGGGRELILGFRV